MPKRDGRKSGKPEGKRDPVNHRTPAQSRALTRNASPKAKSNRREQVRMRNAAVKKGRVSRGDGKDLHHVKPRVTGGSSKPSNIRVVSASKNRGHGMGRSGSKRKRG